MYVLRFGCSEQLGHGFLVRKAAVPCMLFSGRFFVPVWVLLLCPNTWGVFPCRSLVSKADRPPHLLCRSQEERLRREAERQAADQARREANAARRQQEAAKRAEEERLAREEEAR